MHKYLFLLVVCLMFAECSSSRFAGSPYSEPVQLTDEEQLDYDHDFLQATKLKMFGNMPDAASMLTRCVEVNPRDAAAHYQLSEIYAAVEDMDHAMKHARLAARYDSDNYWYKLQLVNMYMVEDNLDSAIIVYRQIADTQPYNSDIRYNMASLYLEKSRYRKAIKELKAIEAIYGFTEELALAKYRVYSKKGDFKAAEALLKKSTAEYPEGLFYGLLAELYSMSGREKEAQENYVRLLEVDPENAVGYISMIEFYADYGNYSKAIEEMRRMYDMKTIDTDMKVDLYLKLSADSVFFKENDRQLDELIGQLYERYPDNFRVRLVNTDRNLRAQNYEGAKEDLLFLTDHVQTNYYLWEQLLYVLNFLHDYEVMYGASAKALKNFSNRYLFNFFHGYASTMLKKYDEAISSYFLTLEYLKEEKNPDYFMRLQTLVYLGEACNEQKRYAESDSAFDMALTLAPNDPMILNNYSYYLSLRGEKLDLAEKYITQCIAAEPDNSTYLDTYGWVLYRQGRIDEAITVIEKALKNGGSDNTEIVDHLCEILTVAGRIDEARLICRDSTELNNSTESADRKVEPHKVHKDEKQDTYTHSSL